MKIEIPEDFYQKLLADSAKAGENQIDYLIDLFNFGRACLDNSDLPISMVRSLQKSTSEKANIRFNFEQ